LETEARENLRIRTEKFLTAAGGGFDPISPADVKRLVLELKMRQVQLEMQNEALQRAQETITQARDRYADLYDFAPVGYFTLDRRGKIVEVNLAGARLLGVERHLLINQSSFRWVAPESREACRTHYRKVFANQGPQACEAKLRRRGGPPFYAALDSVAAAGKTGVVLHCRTAMSDITDRKQAEIELKLKERLLDGASDSIFLHDLEGHFIYVNEAAWRGRGYERAALLGKDVGALMAPDYAATRGKILQDLHAQGEITFESAHVRKDGSIMPVEIHARFIDLGDRRLILSVARDISERKKAEAEVKRNEARLAGLLRISQYASTSIQELLDYALDEAIALTDSQIGYIYFYDETRQQFTLNTWSKNMMQQCAIANPQTIYHLEKTGLWGEAVRQAGPVVVNDFQQPHLLKKGYPPGHANLDKFLTVPIFHQGRIVAVAGVANKAIDYEDADVKQLTLMMEVVWQIVERQRAEAEVQHSLEKLKKALDGTVLAVANTVEMRDPYTAGHQRRVAQLAGAIAQEMGFSAARVEGMRVLGCLHDVGKIAIPAEILSKPGHLSPMEFTLIKDHPRVGYEIIKDINFPSPLAEGILQHHERLNGSGYPLGISGADISLEARILGVADVVEAMASHRPYRKGLGIDQALEEISRNRGVLYDPEVVDLCLKLFIEKGFSFSP
jgi:PAS domain S-box-containing protein/putative nucleotidyltransferase with HDIG domain